MATSKRRLQGQQTANNDCHRKRQELAGANDEGDRQEQADDDNDDRLKQQSTNEGGEREG